MPYSCCAVARMGQCPRTHRASAYALQIDMERDLLLLPQHFGPNIKEHLRTKLIEKVRERA